MRTSASREATQSFVLAEVMVDEAVAEEELGVGCVGTDELWAVLQPPEGPTATAVAVRSCSALNLQVTAALPQTRGSGPTPFRLTLYLVRDGAHASWSDTLWIADHEGRPHVLSPLELLDARAPVGLSPDPPSDLNLETGDIPGEAVLGPFEVEGRCRAGVRCVSRGRGGQ